MKTSWPQSYHGELRGKNIPKWPGIYWWIIRSLVFKHIEKRGLEQWLGCESREVEDYQIWTWSRFVNLGSSKTILFLLFIRGFTTPGWIDLQKVDCLLLSFLSISSEMQLSTLVAPADYTKAGTFDAARDLDDVLSIECADLLVVALIIIHHHDDY